MTKLIYRPFGLAVTTTMFLHWLVQRRMQHNHEVFLLRRLDGLGHTRRAPGEHRPYTAGTKPTNLVYYMRRGATTFPIMPSEVRALAISQQPP